jgi:hypothetical protein
MDIGSEDEQLGPTPLFGAWMELKFLHNSARPGGRDTKNEA